MRDKSHLKSVAVASPTRTIQLEKSPCKEGDPMMCETTSKQFAPVAFLSGVRFGQRVFELMPEQSFFVQGDPADSVFCLQTGRARISVVSAKGKQAIITLLGPGDFFGEESLAIDAGLRKAAATAVIRCTALKISRKDMVCILHQKPEFADQFLSYLLGRSMRTQADLVDQLFNSSEKRLARTLLLMAEVGKPEEPQTMIPPITHETLAEMIGTTRSRVSFFMNRFRNLGLISYKDRIRVHKPRLQAVLLDQFAEV
jgi:CRP-like cAMP-binding protein